MSGSGEVLAHVPAAKAAEVCERVTLGEEAKALLKVEMTPKQYLTRLIDGKQPLDAIRFLAYALPKREAVWWACLCARKVADPGMPEEQTAALRGAEAWVVDPTEENRRAAMPLAEAAGLGTPAGCAAMAAFWSGGSLAPPNVPAVPPADHLTAHGAAGSVMFAAVISQPEKAPAKYQTFFELGLGVAEGRLRWGAPPTEARKAPVEPAPARPAPTTPPPRPVINWD